MGLTEVTVFPVHVAALRGMEEIKSTNSDSKNSIETDAVVDFVDFVVVGVGDVGVLGRILC